MSKRYFPGAHAYQVNPTGAQKLIDQARVYARPTDVFLNIDTFPWLQEYYPWPVEARDTFTTIQKTEGCLAKHNYNDSYKII
jgi:GR25 family glycosyltransferase involved in LPS biosynthesis